MILQTKCYMEMIIKLNTINSITNYESDRYLKCIVTNDSVDRISYGVI